MSEMSRDLEPEFIQHGLGPYRYIKIGDDPATKFYVGAHNMQTGRTRMPMDGGAFYVDDPELGSVMYDGTGRRMIEGSDND